MIERFFDGNSLVGVKGEHPAHEIFSVVTDRLPGGRVELWGEKGSEGTANVAWHSRYEDTIFMSHMFWEENERKINRGEKKEEFKTNTGKDLEF